MAEQTVYLVDDDRSCLKATARMLRLSGYQVETFSSPLDLLARITPDVSGCIVMDLRMPDMDGLALQRTLHERECLLPIIFLTAYGDIPTTVTAMRDGAQDFLTKDAPAEALVSAIDKGLEQSSQNASQSRELAKFEKKRQRLTRRQWQVLERVVQGKMNKQIAAELGIHERTVKLHRALGMKKLGISSVPELSILWSQARGK